MTAHGTFKLRHGLWIALAVVLQSAALACAREAGAVSAGASAFAPVVNPWYALQLGALVLQALCWVQALRWFPLSFAYPFMSLVFPLALAWAWWAFGEPVGLLHLAGVVLIVAGVALVAREQAR